MFLLAAVVCATAEASSCEALVNYKYSWILPEDCEKVVPENKALLEKQGFYFVDVGCFVAPEQPGEPT